MRASWHKVWVIRLAIATLGLVTFAITAAFAQSEHPTLTIGSPAPDFTLPGVDGKTHSIEEYTKGKLLGVVFTCNHCPTAQLYEDRIKQLVTDFGPKGLVLVAIQPNNPNALRIDEMLMSDMNDSLDEMKTRAAYRHFNFDYLYDGATQSVAEVYGPKATPHIFIFDKTRKLRYEGRVDDNQREPLVKSHDAHDAIEALLQDKPVTTSHTAVFGCSTKWKSKESSRLEMLRKIEAEPVTVELAGEEELRKLRANASGKYLLVNFWATWCGPCLSEFASLQETFRMYRTREFTMVTVSTNAPDEKAGVVKFLEGQHASSRNLMFDSTDVYRLQAAFDPKWESAVPYTTLIAPDGKILYRKEGEVDLIEMRRTILRNLKTDYKGFQDYWLKP